MTKAEITNGANTGLTAFDGLTPSFKELFRRANSLEHLQRYVGDGLWKNHSGAECLLGQAVYRIHPCTPPEPQYKIHKIGSSGTAYVYVEEGNGSNKQVYAAIGRVDFAGIQYEGSDEWRGVLDTVRFGVPSYIRFLKP